MPSKKELNRARLRRLERETGHGIRQGFRDAFASFSMGAPSSMMGERGKNSNVERIKERQFASEKKSLRKDVRKYVAKLRKRKK